MEIKEFNLEDLEEEYNFLSTLESENGFENNFYGLTFEQFKEFGVPNIQNEAAGINLKEGYVPQTLYFLWDKGHIVAIYKFRHYLTPALINGAGHIGYAVKKEERGKHYGTKGLMMVGKIVKPLVKEDEIYISCNKDNKKSFDIMIQNNCYLHHSDDSHHYLRFRKSVIDD